MKKILIVGGVAGGATAAARLRRLDENSEIIIFERGEHISFANCGLPYFIGGVIPDREALLLQTPESFRQRFNVDVRIQSEVLSIDPKTKTVAVKNNQTGEIYNECYDKLILAPGGAPIKPPNIDAHSMRIFTLRNVADTD
ncbi:MAG: FAD-dependent oxidoreductase, partial [Treponema sp.]|nr:FAD-dependent oxidoreductase [Treponema sp.]